MHSSFMKSKLSFSLVDWTFLLFQTPRLMEVFQIAYLKSNAFACVEATGRPVVGILIIYVTSDIYSVKGKHLKGITPRRVGCIQDGDDYP